MPPATKLYVCKCCGKSFPARVADRKRGWAKFCSKSCKAVDQTRRTGFSGPPSESLRDPSLDPDDYSEFSMSPEDLSYGGYGDADWNKPFGDGKF